MKLYKTCNGCKAKRHSSSGYNGCWLHFDTKPIKKVFDVVVDVAPNEPCPKPKTNELYIYLTNKL